MYYYKRLNAEGVAIGVLTSDIRLVESEGQKRITSDEYIAFVRSLPSEEQRPIPQYTITDIEIARSYSEGVQDA